jgi:hypothetical protein
MKVEFEHHRVVAYTPRSGDPVSFALLPLFEAQQMGREGSGRIMPRGGVTLCRIIGASGSELGAWQGGVRCPRQLLPEGRPEDRARPGGSRGRAACPRRGGRSLRDQAGGGGMTAFNEGREEYRSDIELGVRYRDKQTGIEGTATALHFYQFACERVTIEAVSKQSGELQEYGFDAPRLVSVEAPEEPVRQQRTGGPARHGERREDMSATRRGL